MELHKEDISLVLSRLSRDVLDILRNNEVYLSGGFIRSTISGEKPNDIDIFGSDKEKLKLIAYGLSASRGAKIHETDNALTVLSPGRIPVQFITRWIFEDVGRVIESFDFTVCQSAIWWLGTRSGEGRFCSVCSDRFYIDLASKRLTYTSPIREEEPGGSMLRVIKFTKRGYNIQCKSLADVMTRLYSKLIIDRVTCPETCSKVICGLLRDVDPLHIVDGVEFSED